MCCLMIFDFFLFSTGNPSLLFRLFGGFFWILLLAMAMLVSSFVPPTFRGQAARPFQLLLSIIGILSILLIVASPYATEFASARMEAQILSFVKDPLNFEAEVLDEARQLMVDLTHMKYHKERIVFVPTFREMDYHLRAETGEKYQVTIATRWDGTPVISVKRVDS